MDDDGRALDIDEIADFVQRGTATFHSGPVFDADGSAPQPGASSRIQAEKRFAAQAAKAKTMDEAVVSKLGAPSRLLREYLSPSLHATTRMEAVP